MSCCAEKRFCAFLPIGSGVVCEARGGAAQCGAIERVRGGREGEAWGARGRSAGRAGARGSVR